MSGRWWRAYSRARHDPKLLKLSDKDFRWWFNFVCVAADNDGRLPPLRDLAAEFRTSENAIAVAIERLRCAGLFEIDGEPGPDVRYIPHNWNGLQYVSDSSSNRVKQFRERQRNVSVTPSESETDTDTEKTGATAPERASAPAAKEHASEPRTKLPSDWRPSIDDRDHASDKGLDPDTTAAAFTDYFGEGRGRSEKRTGAGWSKRFRIWVNTDAERKSPARGGSSLRPALDGGDVGAFARAAARLGRNEPV